MEQLHRLKELREELGMTQTQLAEALGGDEEGWYFQRVQRLEANARDDSKGTKLTMAVAREICRKLKRPLKDLIPGVNTKDAWEQEQLERLRQLDDETRDLFEEMLKKMPKKEKS